MNWLILDTETTGTDPKSDRVIEVGAILYSVKHRSSIYSLSFLVPDVLDEGEKNPTEPINRIPAELLQEVEFFPIRCFYDLVRFSDYVVAHNAVFDRQWFGENRQFNELPLPWLCSMSDFTFPRQIRPGDNLVSLALAHGIGVNSAHRALTVCQLLAALFDRMEPEWFEEQLQKALRPKFLYMAVVDYDNRQQAKKAGFHWDTQNRRWVREMAEEDAAALPFQTLRIFDKEF